MLTSTLVLLAAAYGAAAGFLVPRAAYRFAVEYGEPRRAECPSGHPLPPAWRGWLGPARCAPCARAAGAAPEAASAVPGDGEAVAVAAAEYGPRRTGPAAAGAMACAALALFAGPRPELAVWLLAAPVGLLLSVVDIRVQRLPDVLTLPLAAAVAALLGLAAVFPSAQGSWTRALTGGLVLGAGFLALFLLHPRGLGFGDVKLALTAGVALGWYGWQAVCAGALLAFTAQALTGLVLIVAGRAGRKSALPFGPFLLLGAVLGMPAAAGVA